MALEIKGMKRVFKMKKNSQEIVLDDPNVNMSPAEVMDFYSMNYPELTTATVHGPEIEDDRAVLRKGGCAVGRSLVENQNLRRDGG